MALAAQHRKPLWRIVRIVLCLAIFTGLTGAATHATAAVVDSPQLVARIVLSDTLDNLGRFIAPAGDFNHDGYDDVWLSRSFDLIWSDFYLFYGGDPFDTVPDLSFSAPASSIHNVGDVNDDQYDDVIVLYNEPTSTHARYWGLHYGGPAFSSEPAMRFAVFDTTADQAFTYSVAGADMDGDGKTDLLLGEPGGSHLGGAYFYSSQPTFDTIVDMIFRWGSYPTQKQAGLTCRFIPNFDGRSYVAVSFLGSTYFGGSGGAAFFRAGLELDTIAEFVLHYPTDTTHWAYGMYITPFGDADGNGFTDFLLGATSYPSYVYFGTAAGDTTPDIIVLPQHDHTDAAGDMNHDGYPDFAVSESAFQGRVWIYHGGPGMDGIVDMKIIPPIETVGFGTVTRLLGDVNHDGAPDLGIRAGIDDPGFWPGVVYIYGGYGHDPTDVPEEPETLPDTYGLSRVYPNPCNPGTTIEYRLPVRSHIELAIFNLQGQQVVTLLDAEQWPGRHVVVWDGRGADASPAASGVYFCRLHWGDGSQTKKVVLIR